MKKIITIIMIMVFAVSFAFAAEKSVVKKVVTSSESSSAVTSQEVTPTAKVLTKKVKRTKKVKKVKPAATPIETAPPATTGTK
ncbi:MAG: hypothetical protein N3E50_03810 [Candidatus Goldbacteria bacterium]|nr:hypothetical protein [Candidatus Goldiibacteriota bacterium]